MSAGIELLKEVGKTVKMPPVGDLLGWKLLEIEPGRIRVRYTAGEQFLNPQGNVQGGILASMLDDAMGPAAFTLVEEGQFVPTLEMKVSFFRPVKPGTLIAEGRVVHRTRSVVYVEGDLSTEDGDLVGKASATLRVVAADLPKLR